MTRFRRGNSGAGGASGTVDVQVGASGDDGRTAGTLTDTDDFLATGGVGGTDGNAFLMFRNISIPNGATINVAKMQLNGKDSNNDGAELFTNIYMEDVDNPTVPTSVADYNGRARTTAFTAWDEDELLVGVYNDSPDIGTVVKEIVDRGGWVSGQYMQILWDNDVSTDNKWYRPKTYDHADNVPPKLHIEWST